MTLRFWADFSPTFARFPDQDPLAHITSRLAVEAKGVDINHFEAMYSYFPVQFRLRCTTSGTDSSRTSTN